MLYNFMFKIECFKYKHGFLPLNYFEDKNIDSHFWSDVLVRDFDFTSYDWGYYDDYV